MYGEHIEAMGQLMIENGERVTEENVRDLAMSVEDILFAQGLVTEGDDVLEQIEQQARYLFNL